MPAQAAGADRSASVVRLLDRRVRDARQVAGHDVESLTGGVIDQSLSSWFAERLKDADLSAG